MLYTKKNYVLMPVGDVFRDVYAGTLWRATKKLRDGVVLQNIAGGTGGAIISAIPPTCRMEFEILSR